MVTGANRGGKSTFLRSLGQAQLMMQCGMFVAAASYGASTCDGLFTHFKREEDSTMRSGRLDEELARMSEIVDLARPGSMVLANESFASTNEREGSEIARQIVRALIESGVRILYVTHLYDLAHGFFVQNLETALFLRAEREDDTRRTFKVIEAEPLPTSYGEDLYKQIFLGAPRVISARGALEVRRIDS
jgi:DNA mismatch repair ATPase MutS